LRAAPAKLPVSTTVKNTRSWSKVGMPGSDDGGGSEQGEDDPSEPILPSIQAFVREQPSAAVLDNASDLSEPRAVGLADLADVRLNPVT
jgi:hypothetical protein